MQLVDVAGPPSRWVCRYGRPSRVAEDGGWMPSYEHESGEGMLVLDFIAILYSSDGQAHFFPSHYGEWCVVAPDGPVPLWHSPEAQWVYRPIIYRMTAWGYPQALGSQKELQWRRMLCDTITKRHVPEFVIPDYAQAEVRANSILMEHLSAQQRIEKLSVGTFRVRGGRTKNVYQIEPGNGFRLISAKTLEEMVSYCLHPEEYIPDDDVALATKLWLEDPETELEVLSGARRRIVGLGGIGSRADDYVARLERKLIA